MKGTAGRILVATGVAAPLVWAAAVIYCGTRRAGYDPVNQFMSELAERGSQTESIMRIGGFYLPGLLVLMFALHLLVRRTARPVAVLLIIHGAARVIAGLFPCDPGCPAAGTSMSQTIHNVAAMANGLVVPAAALLCAFRLWKTGRRRFATYSLVSATVATVFLVVLVMNVSTRSHVGLFQRLSFGTMQLWLAAFALSLWPSRIEANVPDAVLRKWR